MTRRIKVAGFCTDNAPWQQKIKRLKSSGNVPLSRSQGFRQAGLLRAYGTVILPYRVFHASSSVDRRKTGDGGNHLQPLLVAARDRYFAPKFVVIPRGGVIFTAVGVLQSKIYLRDRIGKLKLPFQQL